MKSGGIGLAGILGVVFITLKLTGHITWSWLWVLAPFGLAPNLHIDSCASSRNYCDYV